MYGIYAHVHTLVMLLHNDCIKNYYYNNYNIMSFVEHGSYIDHSA